jgi:hypothetical protein
LIIIDSGDEFNIGLSYGDGIISEAQAEVLARCFDIVLTSFLEKKSMKIADLQKLLEE